MKINCTESPADYLTIEQVPGGVLISTWIAGNRQEAETTIHADPETWAALVREQAAALGIIPMDYEEE